MSNSQRLYGSIVVIENVVAYNTTKEYEENEKKEYATEKDTKRNQILLSEDEIRKMNEKKGRK